MGEVRKITLEEAEVLSKATDYAVFAVADYYKINWADAAAFYMEGYNQAVHDMQAGTVETFVEIAPRKGKKVCRYCRHFSLWGVSAGVCLFGAKTKDKMEWESCKHFKKDSHGKDQG